MGIKCIALINAKAGMKLAKPVEDDKGRTLCSSGTELNGRLITRFERMEIPAIYVESDDKLLEEDYQKEKDIIEDRFSNISKNNILYEIKSVLLDYLEKRKG